MPADGSDVFVRLWYRLDGIWLHIDETYQASVDSPVEITSPAPGAVLSDSNVTFEWESTCPVSSWRLRAGSTAGASDYFDSGVIGAMTATAAGIPISGQVVFVTIEYRIGEWYSTGEEYVAADNF